MANILTNSNFDNNLNGWVNGVDGGYAFGWVDGQAEAISYSNSTSKKPHKMWQLLDIDAEVIDAKLDVFARWESYGGDIDGSVEFEVYIIRPDGVYDKYYQVTHTGSSESRILSNVNVLSTFQAGGIGTYKLLLIASPASAKTGSSYIQSFGYFDWTSLNVSFKYKKIFIEQLPVSSVKTSKESKFLSGSVSVSENCLPIRLKMISELINLSEKRQNEALLIISDSITGQEEILTVKGTQKSISESLGISEALLSQLTKSKMLSDSLLFSETLVSLRKENNNEIVIYYPEDISYIPRSPQDTEWIRREIRIAHEVEV